MKKNTAIMITGLALAGVVLLFIMTFTGMKEKSFSIIREKITGYQILEVNSKQKVIVNSSEDAESFKNMTDCIAEISSGPSTENSDEEELYRITPMIGTKKINCRIVVSKNTLEINGQEFFGTEEPQNRDIYQILEALFAK